MRSVLTLSLGSVSLEKELHFHGLLQPGSLTLVNLRE